MSVHLSIDYRAQLIVDVNGGLTRKDSQETSDFFEKGVAEVLSRYKRIRIDDQYVRYGLDIGLISNSKEELGKACHDIANVTQEHPSLKDIYFESFEGIPHN